MFKTSLILQPLLWCTLPRDLNSQIHSELRKLRSTQRNCQGHGRVKKRVLASARVPIQSLKIRRHVSSFRFKGVGWAIIQSQWLKSRKTRRQTQNNKYAKLRVSITTTLTIGQSSWLMICCYPKWQQLQGIAIKRTKFARLISLNKKSKLQLVLSVLKPSRIHAHSADTWVRRTRARVRDLTTEARSAKLMSRLALFVC